MEQKKIKFIDHPSQIEAAIKVMGFTNEQFLSDMERRTGFRPTRQCLWQWLKLKDRKKYRFNPLIGYFLYKEYGLTADNVFLKLATKQ